MTALEEAAAAAQARGREKALFEVVAPLSRNGAALAIGQRIKLSRADADILIALGRIKPAKGKANSAPAPGPSSPTGIGEGAEEPELPKEPGREE
jgi:hypothetical protein